MINKLKAILQVEKRKIISLVLYFSMGILLMVFLSTVFFVIFQVNFYRKIYPGVKINDLSLEGKTHKQAEIILKDYLQSQQFEKITFRYEEKIFTISSKEIQLTYSPEKTAEKAYLWGRSSNLLDNSKKQLLSLKREVQLGFSYELDNSLLEEKINIITAQIETPAIPPVITVDKTKEEKIRIEKGKSGIAVDKQQLNQIIENQLAFFKQETIDVPIKIIFPPISDEKIQQTQKRAEKLLGKTIIILSDENEWRLTDEEIINFLSFNNDVDEDKVAVWVSQLAKTINQPAQNALFNFQNEKVVEFKAAKRGEELDQEKTIDLIKKSIVGLEKEENKEAQVHLPIVFTEPKIKTEEVNNLGIKELIGEGSSYFRGSISSRIFNIELASSRFNGILIPPGETFSFNNILGEVSQVTGFKQAYIIKDGKTVLGDGGGVCQVSTTLFRAALNAGLPIEERQAHAYRVSYYEQNSAVGLDATVFEPTVDLKFKNNTSGYVLIQNIFNRSQMKLTFQLYGTSDGRQVTISPSKIWDQTPPPPDLYQDDPSLPVGVIKQIDWKAWGAKASFGYKVVRNEEVLEDTTFYSFYKPWQAIFLKGTGGQ